MIFLYLFFSLCTLCCCAPLRYLRVSRIHNRTGRRGDNFVGSRAPSAVDVRFHRVFVNGKAVRSNEAWNMRTMGTATVSYA